MPTSETDITSSLADLTRITLDDLRTCNDEILQDGLTKILENIQDLEGKFGNYNT